jgi:hypothetical protein
LGLLSREAEGGSSVEVLSRIAQWDWKQIVAVAGVVLTVVQTLWIRTLRQVEYRRYWEAARSAHAVMAHIESVRGALEKSPDCSPGIQQNVGRAFEGARLLVRSCLENVFHRHGEFSEAEEQHFVTNFAMHGYMLEEFRRMRLDPETKSGWKGWLKRTLNLPV